LLRQVTSQRRTSCNDGIGAGHDRFELIIRNVIGCKKLFHGYAFLRGIFPIPDIKNQFLLTKNKTQHVSIFCYFTKHTFLWIFYFNQFIEP